MKKKVPDKVYRGGSGGGKKRCRKDKGGHTLRAKRCSLKDEQA